MDLILLRSLVTVVSFAVFLGIVYWAYSGRNRRVFESVGRSVIDDDDCSGIATAASRPLKNSADRGAR